MVTHPCVKKRKDRAPGLFGSGRLGLLKFEVFQVSGSRPGAPGRVEGFPFAETFFVSPVGVEFVFFLEHFCLFGECPTVVDCGLDTIGHQSLLDLPLWGLAICLVGH